MNVNEIIIEGARENNLKNVSVRIPKRKITVFTGVSGSGKSSLVFDTISAEAQRQLKRRFLHSSAIGCPSSVSRTPIGSRTCLQRLSSIRKGLVAVPVPRSAR